MENKFKDKGLSKKERLANLRAVSLERIKDDLRKLDEAPPSEKNEAQKVLLMWKLGQMLGRPATAQDWIEVAAICFSMK